MLFESKFPALTIKVLVRTVTPVVQAVLFRLTSVSFFSRELVSADLNFRASERTALMRMHARV